MTDDEFLAQRIAAAEARIIAIESAILTVASGGTSYSFDDGQTRQTVTRSSLSELTNELNALISLRASLLAQLGRGQVTVRPRF